MRNLKKILALVLALVMSLSLMATASAASFQDVKDDNPYKTAIDILTELKVVKGYGDGNFQPDGQLTRAEAAVLVYRIATGDVEDKYLDNYTFMQQSKFTDLEGYNWAKGYINYCQNAGIVVGTDATHFNPGGKVTGYQLLVMLLRTLGYGKAGEFTDPKGWELQTAAIAEREKITKNVTDGDFHSPAPRAMVAEILFQGLLTETVTYSALTSGGYTKGETLGMREFKLEELTGVITANEYADLYGYYVLKDGQTKLLVNGEDEPITLSTSTKITDIGESRLVYTTNRSGVVAMYDEVDGEKLNVTKSTGAATDISTNAKFQAAADMPAADDIEYYINFDRSGDYDCDQRLEFNVTFYSSTAENTFNGYTDENINTVARRDDRWTVEKLTLDADGEITAKAQVAASAVPQFPTAYDANTAYRYTKIIFANVRITDTDLNILRGIFGIADNKDNNLLTEDKTTGDVFVGTKSTATTTVITLADGSTTTITTNGEQDISNQISYNAFVDQYINPIEYYGWEQSLNGYWVKFIDNDGDGKCDYAFRTSSWLDEVIDTYTNKDGDTVMCYNRFDDDDTFVVNDWHVKVRYMDDYAPTLGDKVICSWIEDQILVEPAKDTTETVKEYSWRNDEITTTEGNTYGQSGIGNWTEMLENIDQMDDGVKYIMYFDHFGYVRAYEIPGGNNYALITEIYATNNNTGNLVQKWPMTVELTMPNEEGAKETKEYNLTEGSGSPFVNRSIFTLVGSDRGTFNYYNYLQPALSNLGVTRTDYGPNPTVQTDNPFQGTQYSFWNKNYQIVKSINNLKDDAEFNYGASAETNLSTGAAITTTQNAQTVSFTNVAVATVDGDNASLKGAAQLKFDKDGTVIGYATNYIQLDASLPVAAGAVRYPINNYNPDGTQDTAYINANNNYVNAVHDTQYYIVYNGGVEYFTDFTKLPNLTDKTVGRIHAAYAVARDIRSDNDSKPYWVADVIVFEVEKYEFVSQTSVALAYYTPTRISDTVQYIKTLNSKYGPMVDLTPSGKAWAADQGQWGVGWTEADRYGFYRLYNDKEPVDGVMTAESIKRIGYGEYTDNAIHAGTITRAPYIANNGLYIDVETVDNGGDAKTASIEITDKIYSVTQDRAYTDSYNGYTYNEAGLLRYKSQNSSEVKVGDKVIWIGGAKLNRTLNNDISFVVDLGNDNRSNITEKDNYALFMSTPNWLVAHQYVPTSPTTGYYQVAAQSSTSAGEWQKIMYEQANYTPAVTYKNNVIISTDDVEENDDGSAKTIEVAKYGTDGKTLDIAAADFATKYPGFTFNKLEVKNSSGSWVTLAETYTGHYVFDNLDGDLAVNAVYDDIDASLKVTNTAGVTTTGFSYTIGEDAAVNGSIPTTAVTAVWGDTFEISFPVVPGEAYTATVTSAAGTGTIDEGYGKVENGKFIIKGTIKGDLVIELTKAAATDVTTVAVTVAPASTATVTFTSKAAGGADLPATGGVVSNDADVTFKVAPTAGNEIVKVEYVVEGSGDPAEPITADAGIYKILSSKLNGLDVKITVTTASTTGIAVTFDGTADRTNFKVSKDGGATWMPLANTTVQPASGELWINTGATGVPTPTATVGTVTPEPAGSHTKFKVAGITGATTITINDATAIGAGALTVGSIADTTGVVTNATGATGTLNWAVVDDDPADAIAAVTDINNTVGEVNTAIGGTLGTDTITPAASLDGKWVVWADVAAGKVVGIVAAQYLLKDPTDNAITIAVADDTGVVTLTGTTTAANVFYKIVAIADIEAVEAKIAKWNILTTKATIDTDLGGLTANNTTAVPAQTTADKGKMIVVVEFDGTGDTAKVITYATLAVPDTVTNPAP